MIHTALAFIKDRLNQHLHIENPELQEDKVVLCNIVNSDGSQADKIENKIVFFLVQLDDEPALKNRLNRKYQQENGTFSQGSRGLNLNLHLLFAANFQGGEDHYLDGLSLMSSVIRFFRINSSMVPGAVPVPTKSTTRKNNKLTNIARLSFELCKLDYNELSHLWSAVGSKLMPSALYKVRILEMDEAPVSKTIPSIKEPRTL